MREWLTVIIILLILGILLDGVRRMRIYRRNALRMPRKLSTEDQLQEDGASSEFPSGGARVVAYRDSGDTNSVTQNAKENYQASKQTKGAPSRIPEQVSLNLDVPVPILMNSLSDDTNEAKESLDQNDTDSHYASGDNEPSLGSLDDLDADWSPVDEMKEKYPNYASEEPHVTSSMHSSVPEDQPETLETQVDYEDQKIPAEHQDTKSNDEDFPAPDMVLVINVMAKRGYVFSGADLLEALLANGLRFGDMDIFHRHESSDGKGKVLFSLANIVMPGVFDLSSMGDFETPGFSMFLSLPIAGDSLGVYNLMADTAVSLAEQLGGELKDENRSVMTSQTIEHDRQRVIEYERKKRLERA